MSSKHIQKISDDNKNISYLKELVADFIKQRDWQKYHTPKNIAVSVAIEAAELLEHFQWSPPAPDEINEEKKQQIAEEIADVMAYLISLVNVLELDVATIMTNKMKKNASKYPVEQFKGTWQNTVFK